MIQIVIVEDTEELRESLSNLINSQEDMSCQNSFNNAESALDFLKSRPVDVVLMDIHLPGMSGIEAVRQLKNLQPNMHFIMCTIFQDDENIFSALQAGASGYLLKMDDFERILFSIRDIYSGGSPMNPQIARRVIESFQKPMITDAASLLSKRELEILNELAKGLRYKEIGDKLFISTETVRKHINNIYQKLQVQSKIEALNKVFRR